MAYYHLFLGIKSEDQITMDKVNVTYRGRQGELSLLEWWWIAELNIGAHLGKSAFTGDGV